MQAQAAESRRRFAMARPYHSCGRAVARRAKAVVLAFSASMESVLCLSGCSSHAMREFENTKLGGQFVANNQGGGSSYAAPNPNASGSMVGGMTIGDLVPIFQVLSSGIISNQNSDTTPTKKMHYLNSRRLRLLRLPLLSSLPIHHKRPQVSRHRLMLRLQPQAHRLLRLHRLITRERYQQAIRSL